MKYREIAKQIKKTEALLWAAKVHLRTLHTNDRKKRNLLSETFGLLSVQKGKEFLKHVKQTRKQSQKKQSFAEFFLYASDEEKTRVFTQAAKQANADQRALMKKIEI